MRLTSDALRVLPPDVARPTYDRAAARRGVVHLGIGAFHRAHQAVICDAALATGDLRWGIVGVSLRSPAVRDQLVPQDGLYTLAIRDGDGDAYRLIGSVLDVLVAPEDPAAVIAAIAAPDTHLVTLTVTEKGYKLDRAGAGLLTDDADVAHDLASLAAPRTVPGFLTAGLAARRRAGHGPLTVLSCDNLPHNGRLLRQAVLAMAAAHDPMLQDWIADAIAFPASMVDRIVPATTPDDIDVLATRIGVEDRAMVKTEPFLQWVIEDRFAGPRPDFAAFGVQLTPQVAPWEEAKLRLLNGAHSGIAYLGGLAGFDFVHEFVATAAGRSFVAALWEESAATLTPPEGLDVANYRAALMARFANPALQHRTRQIAQDGSQKLPQRLVAPLLERARRGVPSPALSLAVAAWMRWQSGVDDRGQVFVVEDPNAAEIGLRLDGTGDPAARVAALLGLGAVFPPALAEDDGIVAALINWLTVLESKGAVAALEMAASHGDAVTA